MGKYRQLQPQDTLFIGGETPTVYQHTGGLVILDARDRPGFGFETFREYMAQRMGRIPNFRWKLHEVPYGLDLPYWVEDDNFNFDHHIRRIAVPSPGDRQALGELVAYLYSRHLDRNRPLWEAWFIEGLPGGRFAIFQKMHHSIMDGEGARKLGEVTVDFEPDAPPRAIDPDILGAQAGQAPEPWRESLGAARRLLQPPRRAGREMAASAWSAILKRLQSDARGVRNQPVPVASFNADISGERGFVFGSLPLSDIKAVKNAFGVTVNDVVLAVVAGSLRNYLLAHDRLPEESLRTSIAVSLRTEQDDQFSNRVTSTEVTLATDLDDPAQRLTAIARDSESAKARARGGSHGVMELLQIMPPVLVTAMMNLSRPEQVVRMTGANLLVSNVRGSERPMYIAGARQVATYPMSILALGMGINVTCVSYGSNLDVGITVEPSLVPEPWPIIDGLHSALDGYLALVSKKSGPGRRSTPKGRASRKSSGNTRRGR